MIEQGNPSLAGLSTEAKQDTEITALANILADLQAKADAGESQMSELIVALRALIVAIANPSYVDKRTNAINIGNNTVSIASSQTLTTLTNQTNFGSYTADYLNNITSRNAWASVVRARIS